MSVEMGMHMCVHTHTHRKRDWKEGGALGSGLLAQPWGYSRSINPEARTAAVNTT
mgnify:CR=1 FL=1